MQLGMIGLGRMGSNMVRRLMHGGHTCVVFDPNTKAREALAKEGATACADLEELVGKLKAPRVLWLMLPAAIVDAELEKLTALLKPGDIVIDGGNSYYRDDIRRAKLLEKSQLHYVDVGTSGGVFGDQRGYCLMIGGETATVEHLQPIFQTLAPGIDAALRTPNRAKAPEKGTAEQGFLHCGPHGAGHFVKMVHNGIEYGMMAAYAEGLNVLHEADMGRRTPVVDAETAPVRDPEFYQYQLNLADVAEVWRRGSVIESWLLDLTADALAESPLLESYAGRVSDSGEGRWTILAAVDEGVPAPVLSAALFARFDSRGNGDYANKVLSAMRYAFGGHAEKPADH